MRYDSIFDVIGHIMVGPSSSHTAGACQIGYLAHNLLGGIPSSAIIKFHGSFAETYRGHGTDIAIIAGLLGLKPDDEKIRHAKTLAQEKGMQYSIKTVDLGESAHPNSVQLELKRESDRLTLIGASIGGGNVVITEIDGLEAGFNGDNPTIVYENQDVLGIVAKVTDFIAQAKLNIGSMKLSRNTKKKIALCWIEVNSQVTVSLVDQIRGIGEIKWVRVLNV